MIRELIPELLDLPLQAVLIPIVLFGAYWIVTRALRKRVREPWAATLVLLLDVIAVPTFLLVVQGGLYRLGGVGAYEAVHDALWSLLAFAVAWIVTRLLRRFLWVRYFIRNHGREAPRILQNLVSGALYLAALGIVLVAVFERSASGVLVSTGVIVGVVGLALQNVLADLFSGITITLEQPYGVGDWISLPDGSTGEVTDVTWQATYLKSFNNSILVIPNSYALRSVVHNYSKPTKMYAVWLTIAVDRSYEPSTVRRLLLEAALSCSAVRKDPTPVVNVSDASGNPIRYTVYVHFRDYVSHFAGRNDLYMNIYGFLGRAGVVTAADKYEVSTEPAGERVLQMPSLREELRNVEFFSMLTEDQIDVLAEHASYHTFYPEEVIVREGKQDNSLFIITSGVVRVTKKDESGEDVEIARLGSGDVLGEMSLLTGEYRSATVTALVQVTVIQVTKEGLQPILQAVPQLSDTFAQVMLDRQLKSRQFLESMRLSKKSASDFVSDYLEAFVRSIRRFFRV